MKSGPRYLSLAIIGALFFGVLIYILLRIAQIQETQEATQTRVEIDTTEEVAEQPAEEEVGVDLLDDPFETEEWKKSDLSVVPVEISYPNEWDLRTIAPTELYLEQDEQTAVKVRVSVYDSAPDAFDENLPLTRTQDELDQRRVAIEGDENATRINGMTALVTVRRDTSSLSVVALTELFVDNDYVVVSLPFDVTEFYNNDDEDGIDAFIADLKEGLPRDGATAAEIRLYQTYREVVKSMERTDVDNDALEEDELEDAEVIDETLEEQTEEESDTASTTGGVYTDNAIGLSMTIADGWFAPDEEPVTLEEYNTAVQVSTISIEDALGPNDNPAPGPTQEAVQQVLNDLNGTTTTTVWTDSADVVLPIETLSNGSRAGVYIGGAAGSRLIKQYTIALSETELLRVHVSVEGLMQRIYPGGRPADLITPQGTLSDTADEELQELFAEFDEMVGTMTLN